MPRNQAKGPAPRHSHCSYSRRKKKPGSAAVQLCSGCQCEGLRCYARERATHGPQTNSRKDTTELPNYQTASPCCSAEAMLSAVQLCSGCQCEGLRCYARKRATHGPQTKLTPEGRRPNCQTTGRHLRAALQKQCCLGKKSLGKKTHLCLERLCDRNPSSG